MLKNITKNMGGGLIICCPPSMKYDNFYERTFLSGDIQGEITQLYKSELLNILLIYIYYNIVPL